ncbi:TonB-dependent receptor plug domain-containing protein [Lutimaribacter sp. EGI FJ00015]|uniref:TonB-dependent receptor plug domain-containing protein n=1 Tax=Lutimaribacter degradans TaxID=2945989 RepID=A0ACC5ZWS0_9RHOB|nr:TonB-dependent receptor [Lutimaribacter sp. EGI FJ00013]MCM2562014.1 TonB-dependent receptor plug domain-containing protein [Lutimaribacter sp. EGI FJ00013]MCO0612954.1 TonB-dependent receptor plug domain-containing protein [Lutimaribacter sp. EGI FJ00015]MCO0635846.1 TonB-dependent receptor plug domain-containing protein [Lutimaribacter sp. EGI FJ00014]
MLTHLLRGSTALVCLSLALPAAAQDADPGFLGTLILTGGKRDLSFGTALPRTVVDEEEIQDRQASTVAQLIDSVPGVTLVNGTTPQGSGINIRGFGANTTNGSDQKIAVQIDGASVGSEELYRIGTQLFTDPLLYREVEVLRGTIGSFAYGSGIVGGVVKLETKDASDFTGGVPGFGGSQTLEYSSNGDGWVSSTNLGWMPSAGAEFLLNYSLRDQGNLTAGDGTTIGNSKFRTPSYLAKGTFTFGQDDAQSLTLSHSRTVADDKDVPYDQFGTDGGMFGNVDRLTDTDQTVLEYRFNPASDLFDLRANLSYADQQIEYDYIPGSSPLEGTPTFPFLVDTVNADQRYETTKLTMTNRALFETGAVSHDMLAGVEAQRRVRADNTAAGAPGGTNDRFALFMVDEMTMGRFTVTPALRYETSRIESATNLAGLPNIYDKDALMGGLALAHDLGNGLSVFGSAAYTEGLPIIDDLGTSASAQRRIGISEKSHTFELGAEYTGTDVFARGDTFTIRGNLYQTELWDITSYTVSGSTTTELDHVDSHGFELEASYGMANGFYVDFAGHLGNGTEFNPDGTNATWRNSPADRAQLALGKKWDDRLDLSWEIVHAADRREALGAGLPDSTVHNLRATWRPDEGWLDGTEVRFGLENILDEDYVGHLSSPSRKAPGRTVKVSLSKSF